MADDILWNIAILWVLIQFIDLPANEVSHVFITENIGVIHLYFVLWSLTHLPLDKMATILQTMFLNAGEKPLSEPVLDPVHWPIYVAPGGDESIDIVMW